MTRRGKFVVNQVDKCTRIPTRDSQVKDVQQPRSCGDLATQQTPQRQEQSTCTTPLAQRCEFALTLVNRLLIGFITIYLCWMSLRVRHEEIPWHAVLCTVGFLCLMSEGLLAYYRGNVWTQICQRPQKTRLHWVLQLCGSIIGLIGIAIKIMLEEMHFQTRHGIVGFATTIVLVFALLSGLSSLFASELKHRLQPRFNKATHNVIGLITYALAMLSIYYAFDSDLFNQYSLDAATYKDFRLLLKICVISIFLLSCYGPVWCLFYSRL